MPDVRVRLRIRGRVQGVFYRASARRKARDLGLTGYAENLGDGSVEIVTEGDLMLKVTTTASARHNAPMVLHADCFQLWNEERRLFKSSPDPGPRHHRTQP